MATSNKCANPLLLQWLEEWLQNAREQNSKGAQTYKKAYDSMKACPIAFAHPAEAQQLSGLGPKLCDRLSAKLKEHCAAHGLPMPDISSAAPKRTIEDGVAAGPTKKVRKPKPYVPVFRSGPYAIVLALSSADEDDGRGYSKTEVIELAQPHCDASFTAPIDPTKYFTAWNAMKTLMEKDLVFERGRPLRKYALTEDGWVVAKRMRKTSLVSGKQPQSDLNGWVKSAAAAGAAPAAPGSLIGHMSFVEDVFDVEVAPSNLPPPAANVPIASQTSDFYHLSSSPRPEEADRHFDLDELPERPQGITPGNDANTPTAADTFPPDFVPLHLPPSEFTVHLVVDTREIRATQDRDYMRDELTRRGVKPIMRSLELGDALWVARRKRADDRPAREVDEIMLDWVVERKRLDDLFRLGRSGVKNVIYIVEAISMSADSFSRYQEAVESAICSTQVVNGYFVKMTTKMDDTIRYLARMTALLTSLYQGQALRVIPTSILTPQSYPRLMAQLHQSQPDVAYHVTYTAFASLASKSESLTLRDVYLKMLMCTKGLTGEKALAIQKKWPTPRALIDALATCGSGEDGRQRQGRLLLDGLDGLVGRKKIGKALSIKVAEVWGRG
ncbi:MAG: Crossover junction endonuclease mus81 [Phylliscum demangeonii]|nr:MAG: Crossover junction endonuclease mus81 [Phylliscum demangeonii]